MPKKNTPETTSSIHPFPEAPADGARGRKKSRSPLARAIDKHIEADDRPLDEWDKDLEDAIFVELGPEPIPQPGAESTSPSRRSVLRLRDRLLTPTVEEALVGAFYREFENTNHLIAALEEERKRNPRAAALNEEFELLLRKREALVKRLESLGERIRQKSTVGQRKTPADDTAITSPPAHRSDAESQPSIQPPQPLPNKDRGRKTRPKPLTKHERVIRQAIRKKLEGQEYVEYLHDDGLATPESWQNYKDDPCPKSYKDAYRNPYWREQIYKEKNRVKTRMIRTKS